MQNKRLTILLFIALLPISSMAQTGITGLAEISLVDAGETCSGLARMVEVHVDIVGLTGTGTEPAGLNSFVLTFTIDSNVFASATPGDNPIMNWGLLTTERNLITTSVTLVGWSADTAAPNQKYHVATLLFSGAQSSVNMSLDHANSSLASRVVNGDGPGPISIDHAPVNFSIEIPGNFDLDMATGASLWLEENSQYALFNTPNGPIDVRDLIRLVSCGAN